MNSDYSLQRTKMVDGQLRTTDVTDTAILDAMHDVPREEFVPRRLQALAYIDEDLEVAPGRYLMEPSPFARLIQLAGIKPADFVLDVGCATGYSAAVLSRIASSVVALESDSELAGSAGETLARLGYDNAVVVERALGGGLPDEAPYDVIVIEGAVDEVPDALFHQLRDGGRLVAVIGEGGSGIAHLFVKDGDAVASRRVFNCAVRSLPGFQKAPEFQF